VYEYTKRNRYYDPQFTTRYPHLSEHHYQDFEQFHLPLLRMHQAHLHDVGIVRGLEVEGAPGGTALVIKPGVAVDGRGSLIVLAPTMGSGTQRAGFAQIGPASSLQQVDVPVSQLTTVGQISQMLYLTIQFAEVLRPTEGSGGRWESVPWLQIQPTRDQNGQVLNPIPELATGTALVLAIIITDATGKISELRASDALLPYRRRLAGQEIGALRVRASGLANDTLAETLAGSILPRSGGGLELQSAALSVTGSLSVAGATTLTSTLSVAGATTLNSTLGVGGDMAINGKHALRGNDSWLRLNDNGVFTSGVRTPYLFSSASLNVGGAYGWADPGPGNAWITSNLTIGAGGNGTIKTRHIDGKGDGNDNDGNLHLNWFTGKDVYIGQPGLHTSSLVVSSGIQSGGDIAINGKHALRGNDEWLRLNQDGTFTSGVYTPHLFTSASLNVGGANGGGDPGAGSAWITGNLTIGAGGNGTIKTRHIDGKGDGNDNDDNLHLNWFTGKNVYIGNPGSSVSQLFVSGNVGIGTTTPAARLSLGAASGQALIIHQNDGANVRAGLGIDLTGSNRELNIFYPGGGLGGHLSIGAVSEDGLYTYSEKIRVTEGGNVGIGIPIPQAKLDVGGDIAISGKHALRGNDSFLRLNDNGVFTSGVHTPHLFTSASLSVGGAYGWADPGPGNAWITGSLTIGAGRNGTLKTRHIDGKEAGNDNDANLHLNFANGKDVYIGHPGSSVSQLIVSGGINYGGSLTKLDIAEDFEAIIRCADLRLGSSARSGKTGGAATGRALVDGGDKLVINFEGDWPEVHFDGQAVRGKFALISSRTLKENIAALSLQDADAMVEQLAPVAFNFIDEPTKRRQVGFIAEEVPELVSGLDRKTIDVAGILAALVKVVQEQQRRLDAFSKL
jgi:hypothetical protein